MEESWRTLDVDAVAVERYAVDATLWGDVKHGEGAKREDLSNDGGAGNVGVVRSDCGRADVIEE
jgi:hypothetical protein